MLRRSIISELLELSHNKRIGMVRFTHLHVHSHYSMLDGMSKVPDLVDKCLKNGMYSIALTDHGNMFGIKEFHDIVMGVNKGRKKEGLEPFKPIFGCEMYVARRGDKSLKETKEDTPLWAFKDRHAFANRSGT